MDPWIHILSGLSSGWFKLADLVLTKWNEKTKRTMGEDTYAGVHRAPCAGSPDRLFRFVSSVSFRFVRFVFVFENFPSTWPVQIWVDFTLDLISYSQLILSSLIFVFFNQPGEVRRARSLPNLLKTLQKWILFSKMFVSVFVVFSPAKRRVERKFDDRQVPSSLTFQLISTKAKGRVNYR